METMFAALLVATLEFNYPVGQTTRYDMVVELEGQLPILGWKQGKAKLEISFDVVGLPSAKPDRISAKHVLTSFRSELNGAVLPFKLENVKGFFPETTISYLASGKVLETNAPARPLPSSMPGLDSQRFPEMSYLPIEWPDRDADNWAFSRAMGDAPMLFMVRRAIAVERKFEFTAKQSTSSFESENGRKVPNQESAALQVESTVTASGEVMMSLKAPIVDEMRMLAATRCEVKTLSGSATPSSRNWKTTVRLKLHSP